MAPKSSNGNTFKYGIKLDLERPKNNEQQQVTVYLIRTNINVSILDWSFKRICKTVHGSIGSTPIVCLE